MAELHTTVANGKGRQCLDLHNYDRQMATFRLLGEAIVGIQQLSNH